MLNKTPDAGKRETKFRIRPGPNLSGDDVSRRERDARGIGTQRKVLRFGSAAQEDAKAHPVGYGAQQGLTGIQAVARVDEIGLAGMQQAQVAQKLALRMPIPQFTGDDQRGLEVVPRLVEPGQAVVNDSQIAQHDALQAGVPQVPGHCQRRLELFESLGEPSLHLVQQTEVAPNVALQLPVPDLLCRRKCCFVILPGLVHAPRVDVENAQVGQYAALPLPVPRHPDQGKRRFEMRARRGRLAKEELKGAEAVTDVALQRSIIHFAGNDQRRLEAGTGRFHATGVGVAAAQSDERTALAAPVPCLVGPRQRCLELRVRLSVLAGCRKRATGNPMHPGGGCCSKPTCALHHGRELDSDPKWPAQTQSRPGALKRVRRYTGIASRSGPATSHDEIVEFGAAIGDGRLLVEARIVRAMSHLCREQRGRTAPRVA